MKSSCSFYLTLRLCGSKKRSRRTNPPAPLFAAHGLEEHRLRQQGGGGNGVRWAVDLVGVSYRVRLEIGNHKEVHIEGILQRIRVARNNLMGIAERHLGSWGEIRQCCQSR